MVPLDLLGGLAFALEVWYYMERRTISGNMMAEISIDELRRMAQGSGITIDGNAREVGTDDEDDALSQEPEFKQQGVHVREDMNSDDDAVGSIAKQVITGPARSLIGKDIWTKLDLLKHLTAGLYLNGFGLPDYIYRADMLDIDAVIALMRGDATAATSSPLRVGPEGIRELNSIIEVAKVPLTYDEGYPQMRTGMPFWKQMEFEPREAHDAFIFYLELDGARKLSDLIAYSMGDLQTWYHMYYWDYRVKAFDLYRVADHQRVKLRRMLSTEDRHYRMAEKLFAQVNEIFQGSDFVGKLAEMDPDKLVKVMETVVKVQRISAGLPAQGGTVPENAPVKQTTTVNIMNDLTQNDVKVVEEESVDVLSESPDMISQVQDMLLDLQTRKGFDE